MPLPVFYEVIVPLLEVMQTAMIMISTPVDSFNFFSTLFSLKDSYTGLPLFLTINCELICERCKLKSDPSNCKHMLKNLPPWKSVDNQRPIKEILKSQKDILQRESMGVVTDNGNSLFGREAVNRLRNREPWRPDSDNAITGFPWCMVTLDPNSSGRVGSAETAIIAMVVHHGQYIIVGMDSHACASAEQVKILVFSFLNRLRTIPELQRTRFVFCAERNMAHESGFIAQHVLMSFPGSYAIMQHEHSDYGWYTTHMQKILYAYSLVNHMSDESITFSCRALCGLPAFLGTEEMADNGQERWKVLREKLFEQLGRYRQVESSGKNAMSITRNTVSGKVDKDGKVSGSFNDDLVFTLSMCVWMCQELLARRLPNLPYADILQMRPSRM